ncbi:MAG: site-specific integrase [Candidatus Bathyarchaeia archaeon]|jgi:site-specific recombinase XerD
MTQQLASDIHHYNQRLTAALSNLENDQKVLDANRKKIKQFLEYIRAEGLSTPRQVRYTYVLRKLSSLLGKEFRRTTKTDMIRVISDLEKQDTAYDTKLSEKQCIKRFYKCLRNVEDDYPVEVKWIRAKRNNNHKILPEHLLTEDEVKRLAETCQNQRDRALILVLYETGCRVGEILTLKLGDVQFDTHGAVMIVKGKTGPCRVRIIFSAKALSEWLNHHPARLDPESPLWTSFESAGSTKSLEYYAFRKMLSVTASRAKIGKRVNPHSFRHARASNLANVLTEAQMKEYLGWVGDSRMASTYVHLSGRNIDNALLKLNGIKTEDEVNSEEHTLRIKTCLRCQEVNSPTSGFCSRCGCPLDVKSILNDKM